MVNRRQQVSTVENMITLIYPHIRRLAAEIFTAHFSDSETLVKPTTFHYQWNLVKYLSSFYFCRIPICFFLFSTSRLLGIWSDVQYCVNPLGWRSCSVSLFQRTISFRDFHFTYHLPWFLTLVAGLIGLLALAKFIAHYRQRGEVLGRRPLAIQQWLFCTTILLCMVWKTTETSFTK